MKRLLPIFLVISAAMLAGILSWDSYVLAYTQYSQQGGDATNCGQCHGNFRSNSYVSLVDGMNWGNLHNLHRFDMLDNDCDACHQSQDTFPVILNSSDGSRGFAISCVGCHGREEDETSASDPGAGLRQHHHREGVTICADCHEDADPANYTPVGENVPPPYYANPTDHPAMPTSPCAADESFAGDARGLDNDGDADYEDADADCTTPAEPMTWGAIKALYE